jgi:putative salt-induced outer membrane protein YdiY
MAGILTGIQFSSMRLVACAGALVAAAASLHGQMVKPDVVYLKNGDKLTGEVKRLQDGILVFKANYAREDLSLDWTQVEHLESEQVYDVRFNNGQAVFAKIGAAPERRGDELVLEQGESKSTAKMADVVVVHPQKEKPLRQLKGSAELGFTLTRASSQAQVFASGSATYSGRRMDLTLQGDSLISTVQGVTTANRQNFSANYMLELPKRWFALGLMELLHSSEQQLELRSTVGGGGGRHLIRTSRTRFDVMAGPVFTNERYTDVAPADSTGNSIEFLTGVQFRTYRFRGSEVNAYFTVLPSLTSLGRVRSNTNIYYKFKFLRDLYWKTSFVNNFDSRPPEGAPRNDYSLTTSFGADF